MDCTRFWLIRHAIVSVSARAVLYGRMDVDICEESLVRQSAAYRALAERLPPHAAWVVTPLARTRQTAAAIQRAGQFFARAPVVEPGLIEQDLGAWQGLRHAELPGRLADPAHPFWPLGAGEVPPGGESMEAVVARVGAAMEFLAGSHGRTDIVCVSHGGAIRAAVAHAIGAGAQAALHFSIGNLGLTVLERFAAGWRVVSVNECFEATSAK